MFVAEAPGRLGAELYGIPLFGDKTGQTFEFLLGIAGLSRKDVFITNAVLCNPRTEAGLNDKPSITEILNCNSWLRQTIELVSPVVVVSLGVTALYSLSLIQKHNVVLREDVGRPVRWFGRYLIPLYHMSPRALIHRNIDTQKKDYRRLQRFVSSLGVLHP